VSSSTVTNDSVSGNSASSVSNQPPPPRSFDNSSVSSSRIYINASGGSNSNDKRPLPNTPPAFAALSTSPTAISSKRSAFTGTLPFDVNRKNPQNSSSLGGINSGYNYTDSKKTTYSNDPIPLSDVDSSTSLASPTTSSSLSASSSSGRPRPSIDEKRSQPSRVGKVENATTTSVGTSSANVLSRSQTTTTTDPPDSSQSISLQSLAVDNGVSIKKNEVSLRSVPIATTTTTTTSRSGASNPNLPSPMTSMNPNITRDLSAAESVTIDEDNTSENGTDDHSSSQMRSRATLIIYAAPSIPVPHGNGPTNMIPVPETELAAPNTTLLYSDRETENLKEIFHFLVSKQPSILKEILVSAVALKTATLDELCDTFLTMSLVTGDTMKMIRFFIEDEVLSASTGLSNTSSLSEENPSDSKDASASSGNNTILRENCTATKFMKIFVGRVGQNYLQEIIGDIINQIVVQERKVSLEVNPSFTDPEELENNRRNLIQKVTVILNRITSKESIDKMPVGIRVLAGYISEFVSVHTPKKVPILIGGFIILRYINPAIIAPDSHGLVPKGKSLTSIVRRNLTLISKILQNISSGILFGNKEQFMVCFNDFINTMKSTMQKYFIDIIVPGSTAVPIPNELNAVTVKDLHLLHRILFQQRDHLVISIKSQLDQQEFGKLLDKLGTYQSKVSFSFLTANDRKVVKSLLEDRHEEAFFVNWIEKKKRNKVQKRLLIIGMNRVITIKPGGKIARNVHLLDLLEIKSLEPREIELIFKSFSIVATCDQTDDIITSIRHAYEYNFYEMPENLRFKVNVHPASRLAIISKATQTDSNGGGFVGTYRSLCDYYNLTPNEEICWDIDNLYENNRMFDLSKFLEQYDPQQSFGSNDLLPITHALRYNRFFTGFTLRNMKLEKKEVIVGLAEFLNCNALLSSLTLSRMTINSSTGIFGGVGGSSSLNSSGIGLPGLPGTSQSSPSPLATGVVGPIPGGPPTVNTMVSGSVAMSFSTVLDALTANLQCSLRMLDLSHSHLDDKGVASLANLFANTKHAFVYLDFTDIGCSSKALIQLLLSLRDNGSLRTSFEFFSISQNKLGAGETSAANALSQLLFNGAKGTTSMLKDLSLSMISTNQFLVIFDALIAGRIPLQRLDLSFNRMSSNQSGSDNAVKRLADYCKQSSTLTELNLAGTFLTDEDLELVLTLLGDDLSTAVNLSANGFGPSTGRILSNIAFKLTSIVALDLSDNELGDEGIAELARGLCHNHSITRVNINGNFKGSKSGKARATAISSLVKLLSSESALQALHLDARPHHPLKQDLIPLIVALESNTTLTELFLSGHQLGNKGAFVLARSLQTNTTLVRLVWDGNQTGLLGFNNIKYALKINKTLKYMPIPMADVSEAMLSSSPIEQKKLKSIVSKIEQHLLNNHLTT